MKIEKQIVECVPNFSEGRDMGIIHQIAEDPGGIVLDIGKSTMSLETVHEIINKRLRRSAGFGCDVVLIRFGEIIDICRYKK